MAHVKVVLREDVTHVGNAGELVRVRAGFARNYLLPRGMAALATAGSIRQVEEQKRLAIARAAKLKASASALATQLGSLSIEIKRQAGEGDKLYGSVTSKDISEAIAAKGYTVDKKHIVLGDALKDLGEHKITIRLGSGVDAQVKLQISRA
jgi:large subunit ribosomal protein L9